MSTLALLICLGSAGFAACTGAVAAPVMSEEPGDVLMRMLAERGLAKANSSTNIGTSVGTNIGTSTAANADAAEEFGLVQQVRDRASDMVLTAMNFLGVPYRRGGSSEETGFDCSGFTRHIFQMSLGLVLPHRADEQAKAAGLLAIKRDELKPGDLVFFNTLRRTFSHVGIYIGDGKFIHSPRAGGEVRVEDMRFSYWAQRFTGARRVEAAAPAGFNAQAQQ